MITIINDSNHRSVVVTASLIMSCSLLSGCVGENSTDAVPMKNVSQNNPNENTEEKRIALCQQWVNALKNINSQNDQKQISYFNGPPSSPSGYAGIRSNVDESPGMANRHAL